MPLSRLTLLALALAAPMAMAAETVACHYTYGGETKVLVAQPAKSPYGVPSIPVGSYFRFRVVFQAEPADLRSVKIYTYADQDAGPALIHQASYPYPPAGGGKGPYGFTGLQFVYEPLRDGELQYWCGFQPKHRKAR